MSKRSGKQKNPSAAVSTTSDRGSEVTEAELRRMDALVRAARETFLQSPQPDPGQGESVWSKVLVALILSGLAVAFFYFVGVALVMSWSPVVVFPADSAKDEDMERPYRDDVLFKVKDFLQKRPESEEWKLAMLRWLPEAPLHFGRVIKDAKPILTELSPDSSQAMIRWAFGIERHDIVTQVHRISPTGDTFIFSLIDDSGETAKKLDNSENVLSIAEEQAKVALKHLEPEVYLRMNWGDNRLTPQERDVLAQQELKLCHSVVSALILVSDRASDDVDWDNWTAAQKSLLSAEKTLHAGDAESIEADDLERILKQFEEAKTDPSLKKFVLTQEGSVQMLLANKWKDQENKKSHWKKAKDLFEELERQHRDSKEKDSVTTAYRVYAQVQLGENTDRKLLESNRCGALLKFDSVFDCSQLLGVVEKKLQTPGRPVPENESPRAGN